MLIVGTDIFIHSLFTKTIKLFKHRLESIQLQNMVVN